jgi:hypothetical protein
MHDSKRLALACVIFAAIMALSMLFTISCGSLARLETDRSVSVDHAIRGVVAHDVNGDGDFDFGTDHFVAGITVRLYELFYPYGTTDDTTNSNGQFEFTGLSDGGDYKVAPVSFDTDYSAYNPPYVQFDYPPGLINDEYVTFYGYTP